ncbi:MAG: murein biosynthesis integral membrane protein MurJ [Puniceicoccales bacterium]|jgi:putative peptidoglycan lipid II flippase|nr:murein biosynthesis integral membrane protein MurJ [Puniceicoccales bacterium]
MNNRLRNIFLVSGSTVLSRISGFARDALFAGIFGISDIGSAFLFAFTVPNLFRRLLGEGALSSAVIPILSKLYATKGPTAVLSLLKTVIAKLLIVLTAMTATGCAVFYLVTKCTCITEKWALPAHFIVLLLPYMIFVCVAAIISAGLNVFDRFLAASLNAIWLNLCMIASLVIGKFTLSLSGIALLDCLSLGVILGGIVQCLVPFFALRRLGIRGDGLTHNAEINEILKLFWPGFLGAAVAQINLLISRNLAYVYCASAVSILYFANRVVELPLGVFGIAIATVIFPDMSKLATDEHSRNELNRAFNHGIFTLLWILLPSAVGLYLIRRELLNVFFEWGIFGSGDTAKTVPILAIYCLSIPFLGISNFLIRSFHALKDTKTPAKIGLYILAMNFALTITLMYPFGVEGMAAATTLSLIIQTVMLYHKLCTQNSVFRLNIGTCKLLGMVLGLIAVCLCVKLGQSITSKSLSYRQQSLRIILIYAPLAAMSYVLISMLSIKSCKKQ